MIKFSVLFLTIIIAFISCNKKTKATEIEKPIEVAVEATVAVVDSQETLEYKIKNNPKLFSKFWTGMSTEEFYKVVEILIDEKKMSAMKQNLDDYKYCSEIKFYTSENSYLEFYENFQNGKLVSISLKGIENVFEIYQNKYKLPNLKYKLLIDRQYIENNPKYNPVFNYEDDEKNQLKLPDCFNDNTNRMYDGPITKFKNFDDKEKTAMLLKSPIIFKSDTLVVIFEHNKIEYESVSYSLYKSRKMDNYWKTEEGRNNLFKISQYQETNSVLRMLNTCSRYQITATYMAKSSYEEKEKIDKQNKQKLIETDRLEKRKAKETLNEL